MNVTDQATSNRRRLIVLGSTGSIGTNTLAVVEHLHRNTGFKFDIVGLVTGSNVKELAVQAKKFNTGSVAIADESKRAELSEFDSVFAGSNAADDLVKAVAKPGDMVVGAMVGSAGLPAIISAINIGCDIALANKETLVAAGSIVMPLVREKGVKLLPVDSEHSAVFQCLLAGRSQEEIERVVLTASGGPFRTATKEAVHSATVEEALNHPTWNMGAKVTIDSATLMNKALEVIEAHWLFDLPAEKIKAIIHPQSIVHSFVEFVDGSIFAQLSPPDMKSPIQYALTWPHRALGSSNRLEWENFSGLEFEPVDHDRFPSIKIAWDVIEKGGTAGTVFNAANEIAVEAFLDRKISFGRITEIVGETIELLPVKPVNNLESIMQADGEAREAARKLVLTQTTAQAYR